MKARIWLVLAGLLAAMSLLVAGCGGDDDEAGGTGAETTAAQDLDQVTLQLKWVTQAQFAGYYAALEEGYYEDEGLDVTLKPGGPDITPEQVVASGQAEFGIDWLPALLAARDQGGDLVNIAQVFGKSGMTEVTWKDSGITDVAGHEGQEGRRLVLRERERAVRGARQERDRPEVEGRRHDRQPAVRHEPVPEQGRRRRGGDDLQRARAGARDGEPGHGRALHARRPERDLDGGRRHGDARGRHLHAGRVDRGRGQPGHRAPLPEGELQGLGVLPRQPGRVPPARARQRPDARRGPPALAAERDQRADLAGTRRRDRRHGRGGVPAHRRHRQAVRGDQGRGVERRLPHRPRRGRGRRARRTRAST